MEVSDVRPTKLIEFENIALRLHVNIRLYEPVNKLAWRLVFEETQDSSIANVPNVNNIGLYEGHCFYINELDVLTNHWKCTEFQQKFTCHDSYDRHMTNKQCTRGQPKLVCLGKSSRGS